MRVQSETSVFKFPRRSVDGPLVLPCTHSGVGQHRGATCAALKVLYNWPNETVDKEHSVPMPKSLGQFFRGFPVGRHLSGVICIAFIFVSLRSRLLYSPLEPGQQNLCPRNHLASKEI